MEILLLHSKQKKEGSVEKMALGQDSTETNAHAFCQPKECFPYSLYVGVKNQKDLIWVPVKSCLIYIPVKMLLQHPFK